MRPWVCRMPTALYFAVSRDCPVGRANRKIQRRNCQIAVSMSNNCCCALNPLKMECGCLHGGIIENGRTSNPLTLCSASALVHVRVWVHLPGDPQECSAEERYNNKCALSSLQAILRTGFTKNIHTSLTYFQPALTAVDTCQRF